MAAAKNVISPFFDASGNKNIGATICTGQEIRCLPYVGFFVLHLVDKKVYLNRFLKMILHENIVLLIHIT